MKKITPMLWFNMNAEEAMNFYTSVFSDSEVISHDKMSVHFRLRNQEFIGLNGGPQFPFTEAVSMMVDCEDQEEVDYFWNRLSEGGKPGQCGWLTDKFGLSWQIVPVVLYQLISDPDRARVKKVMDVMMKMSKLNIAELKQASEKE